MSEPSLLPTSTMSFSPQVRLFRLLWWLCSCCSGSAVDAALLWPLGAFSPPGALLAGAGGFGHSGQPLQLVKRLHL